MKDILLTTTDHTLEPTAVTAVVAVGLTVVVQRIILNTDFELKERTRQRGYDKARFSRYA